MLDYEREGAVMFSQTENLFQNMKKLFSILCILTFVIFLVKQWKGCHDDFDLHADVTEYSVWLRITAT